MRLNPEQQKAVEQVHGPVLILAGAGTGKTRVITSRIASMIRRGIAPENILAVTFTNKAANEMRERVATAVKGKKGGAVMVSTFHSLCVRILRTSIDLLGYRKSFSIYTGSDQLGLVRKLIVKKAGRDEKLDPNLMMSLISRAKNKGIPVAEDRDALTAEVFRAYQNELQVLNAVDFDDLLILAEKVLREYEHVREQWQGRFRYLMVDEFQDTNRLQMELVKHLAGSEQNVCVVGDDDQSIYSWRGAEISNILDFEKAFPDPLVIKLEQNYRSTNRILNTANGLIRHNRNRREKKLWSDNHGDEKVRLVAMPGEEGEADQIVSEIMERHTAAAEPWENFAVLFRMNTQSRPLEAALRRNEIPYRVIGGQSFFDRREVKDLLGYLNVFLNPGDDVNLLRIINNPARGIGDATIALALEYSAVRKEGVCSALLDSNFTVQLSTRARNAVEAFVELIEEGHEMAASLTANYGAFAEDFVERIGYLEAVKRSCKAPEEGETRMENVRELLVAMRQHRARSSEGLRGFLDEVSLQRDKDEEDENDLGKKGVCLITLHAAKGLEFPNVYLVGLEEGILPHSRSVDEGSHDEERRLLYVGITRAMERLTLSYCSSRVRWGDRFPCQPSSFIEELDEGHLDVLDYVDLVSVPVDEEVAESFFGRMKEMLGDVEGYKLEGGD